MSSPEQPHHNDPIASGALSPTEKVQRILLCDFCGRNARNPVSLPVKTPHTRQPRTHRFAKPPSANQHKSSKRVLAAAAAASSGLGRSIAARTAASSTDDSHDDGVSIVSSAASDDTAVTNAASSTSFGPTTLSTITSAGLDGDDAAQLIDPMSSLKVYQELTAAAASTTGRQQLQETMAWPHELDPPTQVRIDVKVSGRGKEAWKAELLKRRLDREGRMKKAEREVEKRRRRENVGMQKEGKMDESDSETEFDFDWDMWGLEVYNEDSEPWDDDTGEVWEGKGQGDDERVEDYRVERERKIGGWEVGENPYLEIKCNLCRKMTRMC